MVDVVNISQLFQDHFRFKGRFGVHRLTGMISCTGDVELKETMPVTHLPVSFDRVGGHFNCDNNQLTTLEGSPRGTGLYFSCKNNPLTSLQGVPDKVGALFWCTYTPQLPLLRLLNFDWHKFKLMNSPPQVLEIMNKYAGEGKKVMLNCALELKKAGFEGNARW